MRKAVVCTAFLVFGAFALWAMPADVTYIEGDASIRLKSGKTQDAQIGDKMNTGDTLRTGADGQAELNQKGVTVKISHGSVFTLMEKEQNGKTSSVLSVALGSIKFRYDKLTGSEPMVRTNGAVAGVRGTEFSVFAGADGSTLIAVDSGQVTVESEGTSIDLAAKEGVEVPLGMPPGDKFTVQRDQIDYSTWNKGKLEAMLADPLGAMTNIETAMAAYIKSVEDFDALFKVSNSTLAKERAKRVKIAEDEGNEKARKYEIEVVTPIINQTVALSLNLRYSTLAALSLRRFVGGRLYLYMKSQYINGQDSPAWAQFLSQFGAFLASFEQSIVPQMVEADI
jgi:hypothetical protein